jgi:predicted nucleic acid-binding protein
MMPLAKPWKPVGANAWSPIQSQMTSWNGEGPGESAVLTIARQSMLGVAILDDAVARNCAKALGISVIGTLGVVLRAKQRGLISAAADVMRALVDAGLHLDGATIRTALQRIGETW